MSVKFICYLIVAAIISFSNADDIMSKICQRLPDNPNCKNNGQGNSNSGSSSSSNNGGSNSWTPSNTGNSQPVNPNVGVPPPPNPGSNSGSSNRDVCTQWSAVYNQYCTGSSISQDHQADCTSYYQRCVAGGGNSGSQQQQGGDPCSQWGPVYNKYCLGSNVQQQYQNDCNLYYQRCIAPQNGNSGNSNVPPQTQPQTQPQPSNVGSTWNALTQQAQQDQAQQALANIQNGGAPNCGQYQQNYNVWCGGAKQINAVYCNTLGRVCAQESSNIAQGNPTVGGPFANSNGLPTGGAGSTRPLTIGQNLGVGPFFGMDKTLGINPLQGVGKRQGINIPILGLGIQQTSGVDYGGLLGMAQTGALLGGGAGGRRRRRSAIPVARDQSGKIIFFYL